MNTYDLHSILCKLAQLAFSKLDHTGLQYYTVQSVFIYVLVNGEFAITQNNFTTELVGNMGKMLTFTGTKASI